jgi:hypothetical protein
MRGDEAIGIGDPQKDALAGAARKELLSRSVTRIGGSFGGLPLLYALTFGEGLFSEVHSASVPHLCVHRTQVCRDEDIIKTSP